MEGIYQMVHNQTTIKRAIDYVREGRMELMQSGPFAPLYMRKGQGRPNTPEEESGQ